MGANNSTEFISDTELLDQISGREPHSRVFWLGVEASNNSNSSSSSSSSSSAAAASTPNNNSIAAAGNAGAGGCRSRIANISSGTRGSVPLTLMNPGLVAGALAPYAKKLC